MIEDEKFNRPVFIGGTGRSGTSIMGDLLGSHPDFHFPAHENKLIVERGGLRDLVEIIPNKLDIHRRHFAIVNFLNRALRMRQLGFANAELNQTLSQMCRQGTPFQVAFDQLQRENPGVQGSLHAIGPMFGQQAYETSINTLLGALIAHSEQNGIVNVDGLLKPFFLVRNLSEDEVLDLARTFLFGLYCQGESHRWGDDTPSNALNLDFLFRLFPKAKFIHMMRDPADTVSSYTKQVWFPNDPALAANQIASMLLRTEALEAELPEGSVLNLRMEDLVRDRDASLQRVADFLEVENRFNAGLIREDAANIGRSDADADENSSLIKDQLGPWMERHGYL
jgi:hypothetical protein